VYLVTLSVVWRMPRHSFFLNRSASGTKKQFLRTQLALVLFKVLCLSVEVVSSAAGIIVYK
jgi:hypothetical protein